MRHLWSTRRFSFCDSILCFNFIQCCCLDIRFETWAREKKDDIHENPTDDNRYRISTYLFCLPDHVSIMSMYLESDESNIDDFNASSCLLHRDTRMNVERVRLPPWTEKNQPRLRFHLVLSHQEPNNRWFPGISRVLYWIEKTKEKTTTIAAAATNLRSPVYTSQLISKRHSLTQNKTTDNDDYYYHHHHRHFCASSPPGYVSRVLGLERRCAYRFLFAKECRDVRWERPVVDRLVPNDRYYHRRDAMSIEDHRWWSESKMFLSI